VYEPGSSDALGKTYRLAELDITGTYTPQYSMNVNVIGSSWGVGRAYSAVNAAAMWIDTTTGDSYAFATFSGGDVGSDDGRLCAFDETGYQCYSQDVNISKPNCAAIVRDCAEINVARPLRLGKHRKVQQHFLDARRGEPGEAKITRLVQ